MRMVQRSPMMSSVLAIEHRMEYFLAIPFT
jgi:hypothetical protein